MDPTIEQWKIMSRVAKEKNLLCFFDCAYQGFASGDARKDAAAVRMFVEDGHKIALVQSFSKNFGLYGQRIGALSVVTESPEEAQRVLSQLKVHIRPNYSNPPRHGARIVAKVLSSEKKTQEFVDQCMGMAKRIDSMRSKLRKKLEDLGSSRSWEHITKQIGVRGLFGLSRFVHFVVVSSLKAHCRFRCLPTVVCQKTKSLHSGKSITFIVLLMEEFQWL